MKNTSSPKRWDIFCKVVDNYGDIGVCYRLARQLALGQGQRVRLWVDELASLVPLEPRARSDAPRQCIEGIEICLWDAASTLGAQPAHVVIEAFACESPAAYVQAMAAEPTPPVWINLDYLSAEDWVHDCHGLSRVDPKSALAQTFFFPGFTPQTGGLLKEADLDARRVGFDAHAQAAFWQNLGVPAPREQELKVSLFAYENEAIADLLEVWHQSERPIYCAAPLGKALHTALAWLGMDSLKAGDVIERGALRLVVLPFLTQRDYDYLLWACDVNFVRGEDSFVRAQWAQKPFVWHIYPQEEEAHLQKLRAFLSRYERSLSPEAAQAVHTFWLRWNGVPNTSETMRSAWQALQACTPELAEQGANWAKEIARAGELSANLVLFCSAVVE